MEKKTDYKINENGSFRKEETTRTTPEDGLVPECEIRPAALPHTTRGKYHVGYSTTKAYSTNDPRITRPIVAVFCGIFLLVGIITLLLRLWLFAAAFIGIAIFGFVKANKDIDAIADKLKKQGKDVTIDSKEELNEVVTDVTDKMKTSFQEVGQETFTEAHLKHFTKKTLPIYCIFSLVISAVLGAAVHVALGILVFLVLAVGGALYYFLILKLLPKLFHK